MSTRSNVGYVKNNRVKASYCHFDGYESHMIPVLTQYIENYGVKEFCKVIDKARVSGGIRIFEEDGPELYDDGATLGIEGIFDTWDWATQNYAYILDPEKGLLHTSCSPKPIKLRA